VRPVATLSNTGPRKNGTRPIPFAENYAQANGRLASSALSLAADHPTRRFMMEKTRAIVLRAIDFSESSSIVTLFTREFGKISGLAKGARRPKGPFEAALDLLAVCRIVFIHKSSDALDLLTEAKLERRFRAATRDLSRLYAGLYVAELLSELTIEADPHPQLFDTAEWAIEQLDGNGDVVLVVLRFEMLAIQYLGHCPIFDECAECGSSVVSSGRVHFGVLQGGVLCRNCRSGKRQVLSISSAALQAMRQLADEQDDSWQRNNEGPRVQGELRGIVNQLIMCLLGRRPRMHEYLGTLTR
jgi:DNA repair protein RecO (recombination protein O)